MNIIKTIRFRLTLLYSLLVFAFCGLFVFAINLYVTSWVNSEPPVPAGILLNNNDRPAGQVLQKFADLAEKEQERIREFRQQDMLQLRQASIQALFPMAAASFIAGWFISGRMLKPLSTLNRQIEETDTKTLGNKIMYDGPDDEIGMLIESFNTMAGRLSNTFTMQEQFIQDASHELKTPLAIIQTNLEAVFEDDSATPEELRKAVKAALDGTNNINRLVEDLLTLSLQQQKHQEIQVTELIENQLTALAPLLDDRKIQLHLKHADVPVLVSGNEFMLGRAVYNILENAIKYADTDTPQIWVETKQKNSHAIITISDNGGGIKPNELPHIFDRFYRADKSRSRRQGGFGLGLAIVKKIVEDHDGTITATRNKGKTVFEMSIPLA